MRAGVMSATSSVVPGEDGRRILRHASKAGASSKIPVRQVREDFEGRRTKSQENKSASKS